MSADATVERTAPATHHAPDDAVRQRALILGVLASSPGRRRKQGELNTKLRTKVAQALGLTKGVVQGVLAQLATEGLLTQRQAGRAVMYELTDTGEQYLGQIRDLLPSGARGKIIPPANDDIRKYRTGYLLLQVLRAPRQELKETEANKQLDNYARKKLELNGATASHLRRELIGQGLVAPNGTGRGARYTLTPAGRIAVGNLAFDADQDFKLSGQVLNDLLETAREVGKQFASAPNTTGQPHVAQDLPGTILAVFRDLLQERYGVTGLVPIADVRGMVRERLGEASARHDVFDEAVRGLWRTGKVRLTPIFDRAKASPEQLRDAIPGVGETLFYLEAVRESAPV
jgi:predicted transcriptional regulator